MPEEYWFDEGCYITELWNTESDESVSVARARVLPGQTTRWHQLNDITERYVILSGTGLAEVGNHEPQPLYNGDSVSIRAGEKQRIRNTGTDDLVFLAVCTPRFKTEAYQDLESDE